MNKKILVANTCIITYSDFLKLKKIQPLTMLIESLQKDGRFYGADMTMDGYDTLDEMAGMFSHLVNHPFDAVKAVREVRGHA